MFELLGYWSIVSIVTFSALMPIAVILYWASLSMMGKILDDDWEGGKAVNNIIEFNDERGIYYKKEVVISPWIMWFSGVGGVIYFLAATIHTCCTEALFGETLINITHKIATDGAPFGLWIVLPVTLYFGIIFGGRKYITVKAKLDTINAKLKEMDNV